MDKITTVWSALDSGRKVLALGATIATFLAVFFVAKASPNAQMSLLYAGLDDATAGGVLAALDQSGTTYEIRGGSIFVPASARDRLRMQLAQEGLPANTTQGYELLDTLSGFGTTSQMFDAAYWRAKEGELARTILASPYIRSARVHISATSARPFQFDQKPTAAVTVTTVNGTLDPTQAEALRYLVASAVPGLSPPEVAIIDGIGGLIGGPNETSGVDSQERAAAMRARIERLLAARVGPGNAVVEVNVETVTDTESIVERIFDPDTRIAISTDIQERSATAQDATSGDVTVASNLPAGDANGHDGMSTNKNTETRSVTNYDVSETQREILRSPGAIKRLSVAVLVNDRIDEDEAGNRTVTPRTTEELDDLRLLVSAAAGLDLDRGDELTIRSMEFDATPIAGTEAIPLEAPATPLNPIQLIQIGVLALVSLILGLFVVRPILMSSTTTAPAAIPHLEPEPQAQTDLVFDGPDDSELENLSTLPMAPMTADIPMLDDNFSTAEDPVDHLRNMIENRREEAIQVLQSWIDDPVAQAGKS